MIQQYIVEWEGVGYYARKQSTYDWCFTKNPIEAQAYRSIKAAAARGGGDRFGSGHNDRPYRLVKVDGNFNILEEPGEFKQVENTISRKKPAEKGPTITLAMLKK